MSKDLTAAKEIIAANIKDAKYGIYDCGNFAGDTMNELYNNGEIKIAICFGWGYFEVFGLNDQEFSELKEYYNNIVKELNNETMD